MKRIGVDVGGTFTDSSSSTRRPGGSRSTRCPRRPDDPARGVVEGVRELCEKAGVAARPTSTTSCTARPSRRTSSLTHTGAEVGMITTEGFRDILHIARHKKPYNFSLQQELPWQSRPLVKRRHRLTVKERVTVPDGDVLVPLDEDEVRERVRRAAARPASRRSRSACSTPTSTRPTSGASRRSCSRSSRRRTSRSRTRCCRSTASTSASRRCA